MDVVAALNERRKARTLEIKAVIFGTNVNSFFMAGVLSGFIRVGFEALSTFFICTQVPLMFIKKKKRNNNLRFNANHILTGKLVIIRIFIKIFLYDHFRALPLVLISFLSKSNMMYHRRLPSRKDAIICQFIWLRNSLKEKFLLFNLTTPGVKKIR